MKPDFAKNVLKASGSAYFDAFSYHDYTPSAVAGPQDNVQLNEARDFRSLQLQYDNGPIRPQWTTEGGLEFPVRTIYASPNNSGTQPILSDMGLMARFLISLMASGSRHFFLYALISDSQFPTSDYNDPYCLLEYDRSISPQLAPYAVLASLVDGAGVPSVDFATTGLAEFHFPKESGKQVDALWAYYNVTHSIPEPAGAVVIDVQGNVLQSSPAINIGLTPVYIVRHASP